MKRREFVKLAGLACVGVGVAKAARVPERAASAVDDWRTFEVTTRVEVLQPVGVTRVWLPLPLRRAMPFQVTESSTVQCERGRVRLVSESAGWPGMVVAEFPAGVAPALTTVSWVRTRNWSVNLRHAGDGRKASAGEMERWLRPTRYVPVDGVVREKALEITRGAGSDAEKARAVYAWVVENTVRNANTRGCGRGDIRAMLETGDLSGKCADLNALFVGLLKASGVPARDVYGVRVGASRMGNRSLGTTSEVVSKAQHCRAEVYLAGYGWVPMDPADVRKVMLEEPPGGLAVDDAKVVAARARLFGAWEMNWVAYNYAQDVSLPGSNGGALPFFMYPQVDTAEGRLDSLEPESFRYGIMAREVGAV